MAKKYQINSDREEKILTNIPAFDQMCFFYTFYVSIKDDLIKKTHVPMSKENKI